MEAKSFEINGINIDIKDEFARQQLDNDVNRLCMWKGYAISCS